MKVVILAGGRGSRMEEATDLKWLLSHDFDEIWLKRHTMIQMES